MMNYCIKSIILVANNFKLISKEDAFRGLELFKKVDFSELN
jgi:hypothetical protein